MKFACLRETSAPPTRRPLAPAASTSRAAWSPGGLVKTLPQFGWARGWVARRQSRASSIRARMSSRAPGSSPTRAPTMTAPSPSPECRYAKPASAAATHRLAPWREVEDLDAREHVRHRPAVRPRVHANGAAERGGDGHPELQPGQAVGERHPGERGEGLGAARDELHALAGGPTERLPETKDEAGEPLVGDQHVGTLAEDEDRKARLVAARPIAARSASDSTSRNSAAGPPTRKVVRGARGNPVRRRSPAAALRISSARTVALTPPPRARGGSRSRRAAS